MDIHIGTDRSERFHFDEGGTRIECPFCSWYLDHPRPELTESVYDASYLFASNRIVITDWQAIYWRIDKLAEAHLIDAHPEEVKAAMGEERYASARDRLIAHGHAPTTFQYSCFLCEQETYERQRARPTDQTLTLDDIDEP